MKILHKMRPCVQKLDTGFCTYSFVSLLVPLGPKPVLRSQTLNTASFVRRKIFPVNLDKILHKISLYFWKLDDCWQSYEGLSPEDYKKAIKNSVFAATPSMTFSFNSCQQNPPFLEHKIAHISGTTCPNLKSKLILRSSH